MSDRKAIAAAFRAAKRRLWEGRGRMPLNQARYICFALRQCSSKARFAAEDVISERIGGRFGSMSTWLAKQGIPQADMTSECLQAHRHAWLDKLIAEFEGDDE